MARRNNLYLFAWLCALVLPLALQWMAGAMEDVRSYLDFYYGPLSLWMFFSLTYGFGTVFVGYYLVSGYRRAGTLDLLRVSEVKPWQLAAGIYLQLQIVLIPPILGFAALFLAYALRTDLRSFMQDATWPQIAGFALAMVFNEALLAALPCLVIYRREGFIALIAGLLVPVVNAMPIIFLYVLHWAVWQYVAMVLGLLAILLALSAWNVGRMWPPQQRSMT
jgi:hypothetical protein